ncbi:MAG: hypothetical protein IPG50_16705 [Myxococcales bacterium]|nr:hypothetical protein [Myxococcales bacterium]
MFGIHSVQRRLVLLILLASCHDEEEPCHNGACGLMPGGTAHYVSGGGTAAKGQVVITASADDVRVYQAETRWGDHFRYGEEVPRTLAAGTTDAAPSQPRLDPNATEAGDAGDKDATTDAEVRSETSWPDREVVPTDWMWRVAVTLNDAKDTPTTSLESLGSTAHYCTSRTDVLREVRYGEPGWRSDTPFVCVANDGRESPARRVVLAGRFVRDDEQAERLGLGRFFQVELRSPDGNVAGDLEAKQSKRVYDCY